MSSVSRRSAVAGLDASEGAIARANLELGTVAVGLTVCFDFWQLQTREQKSNRFRRNHMIMVTFAQK